MSDFYKLSQDRVQDLMKRQDEFLKNISGGMLTWSSKYLLPEIHKNDIWKTTVCEIINITKMIFFFLVFR